MVYTTVPADALEGFRNGPLLGCPVGESCVYIQKSGWALSRLEVLWLSHISFVPDAIEWGGGVAPLAVDSFLFSVSFLCTFDD